MLDEWPSFFMPNTPFQPKWKEHEEAMHDTKDPVKAMEASDAFEETRAKEMATSKLARDWENDRKQSILKEKPRWVKEQRKKEVDEIKKIYDEFKTGGFFDKDLLPMPGYVLVKIEKKEKQVNGIILPETKAENTGVVVRVSGNLIYKDNEIEPPIQDGDQILFKKYAGTETGLSLVLKGSEYRLMRWHIEPQLSDILGVFYD